MGRVRADGALKGGFLMQKRIIYKDKFSVIGKMGQGPADDPKSWIPPLWEDATAHFNEIAQVIRKDENGAPAGVWGAMNDIIETVGEITDQQGEEYLWLVKPQKYGL
jgi:hypothetical protein